ECCGSEGGGAVVWGVGRAGGDQGRGQRARTRDESAIHRVGERIEDVEAPGTGHEGDLGRRPVTRVPVPLEEVLGEVPDVAEVVEELDHPEGPAELVPAEGRRRDLLD